MTRRLHFPYMFWAHHEGFQSPWCLSQSGMPAPEASFLDGLGVDIAHPCVEAQPALEAQLAELFHVPVERVRVTVGASSAMQFAAMRWFRSGSRVAAETPSYEPLRRLPEFYGADVRLLERRAEDAWLLEPDQARAALSGGSGPGHVFLTNLHNPTGAFLERERMQALAAEAEREGGLLVACEVYMEFVPNERRVHAFELAPNGVSIGGLTKAYGLGGLRIGWMILGEAVAEQALELTDMAYLAYVDPPTPSVQAARRGHGDLAIGNIIGADVLNALFVAGASAAVSAEGLAVGMPFFWLSFPTMIAVLLVFRVGILVCRDQLTRGFGIVLLGCYLAYLGLTVATGFRH